MLTRSLEPINHNPTAGNLALVAQPKTDIVAIGSTPKIQPWQFSSPISKISLPSANFKRARVTVHWDHDDHVEFDQAGLLFVRPRLGLPEPSSEQAGNADTAPSFVKFGLEYLQGATVCAVGSSNPQLDWNVYPLTTKTTDATIELSRYGSKIVALIIQKSDNSETPKVSIVRLLSWPLEELDDNEPPIWIGIYAARPDIESTTKQSLTAQFTNFEVEMSDGKSFSLS